MSNPDARWITYLRCHKGDFVNCRFTEKEGGCVTHKKEGRK